MSPLKLQRAIPYIAGHGSKPSSTSSRCSLLALLCAFVYLPPFQLFDVTVTFLFAPIPRALAVFHRCSFRGSHLLFGRHFDHKKKVYSSLTRDGIAALKAHFDDDMAAEDWRLLSKIKRLFSQGVRHW